MYTQEQILDMYFDRNQQAVSATSQMYGAKLTRFADTMVAHEDALECVNDTYIAAWNKIPPERLCVSFMALQGMPQYRLRQD